MLFGGVIEGEYISLKENQQIEMNWRFKDWGQVWSHVLINLEQEEDDEVIVTVKQTKVPAYDSYGKHVHLDNLENGWRNNIFEKLSKVFGFPIKK